MNQPNKKQRRDFIAGTLSGIAAGTVASLSSETAKAGDGKAERIGLHPDGVPAADSGYTPGILATGQKMIFVSGQGPEDYKADMETQIRQTFERIGKVLEQAGAGFENVVILRSYFVHLSRDLPAYRKVRKEFLSKPYPASTAVGTPELAIPGLEIEIEAVAII